MSTEKEHSENKEQEKIYLHYLHLADTLRNEGNLHQAINNYIKVYEYPTLRGATIVRLKRLLDHRLISLSLLENISNFALEALKKDANNKQIIVLIIKALNYQGKARESMVFCEKLAYSENLKYKQEFVQKYWGKTKGPDFIITGFLKCGTTSLYDYMISHPKILQISQKELMFFNVDKNYSLGLDWYLSNFPPIPENTGYIAGEASTLYCLNEVAAERIKADFPDTKLIFILRNPVNRAISNYYFNQEQIGKNKKTLAEVIEREIKKINKIFDQGRDIVKEYSGKVGFISAGLYVYYIEKWLQLFPREQVLFLQTETLAKEPASVMEKVFSFLNLPPHTITQYPHKNTSSYPPVDDQLKLKLAEFYQPHNQKLQEYLGINFDW